MKTCACEINKKKQFFFFTVYEANSKEIFKISAFTSWQTPPQSLKIGMKNNNKRKKQIMNEWDVYEIYI